MLDRNSGLKEMSLCYTTNSGAWQKRAWQKVPAWLEGNRILAELPRARPLTAFLTLNDRGEAHVSSEHVELLTP